MTCIVSVLLLPGLPTTKTGMRLSTQTMHTKRFSIRASFMAMPSSSTMRLQKPFCCWRTICSSTPSSPRLAKGVPLEW